MKAKIEIPFGWYRVPGGGHIFGDRYLKITGGRSIWERVENGITDVRPWQRIVIRRIAGSKVTYAWDESRSILYRCRGRKWFKWLAGHQVWNEMPPSRDFATKPISVRVAKKIFREAFETTHPAN